MNATLQLVCDTANKHLANNGNVARLEAIGSAAYDININGSDYDYVLRFENGHSVLKGDWQGDGMGHPKRDVSKIGNM